MSRNIVSAMQTAVLMTAAKSGKSRAASATLMIEALLGLVFGYVVYLVAGNLAPEMVEQISGNTTYPGKALIEDVGILLINVGAFILGFLFPFIAVGVATSKMN